MRSQDPLTPAVPLTVAIAQTRAGVSDPLERIMRAQNQRLFRIARGILRDDFEAEDVVQETFIKAFTHASDLRDENRISAWLGKIAVNLARDRLRQKARQARFIESPANPDVIPINRAFQEDNDRQNSPERIAAMGDVRRMIEHEIDALPDGFREVFVMRTVENLSTDETAEMLAIAAGTVKTRLHRAKILLRDGLEGRLSAESLKVFPFGGVHCARCTSAVIRYLQHERPPT